MKRNIEHHCTQKPHSIHTISSFLSKPQRKHTTATKNLIVNIQNNAHQLFPTYLREKTRPYKQFLVEEGAPKHSSSLNPRHSSTTFANDIVIFTIRRVSYLPPHTRLLTIHAPKEARSFGIFISLFCASMIIIIILFLFLS